MIWLVGGREDETFYLYVCTVGALFGGFLQLVCVCIHICE